MLLFAAKGIQICYIGAVNMNDKIVLIILIQSEIINSSQVNDMKTLVSCLQHHSRQGDLVCAFG